MVKPKTQNIQHNIEKEHRELTLPDFKIYYRATVIKTVWYQQKNKQVNQWDSIKSTEIDSHKHSQLISDKEAKVIL